MHEDNRMLQYILWSSSPTEDIRTFQSNTVTYGMAAAPYLAIRSLLYLAEQHSEQYPIGAKIVKSSFYVHDLLCGADSLTELSQIKQEVTHLLELGKFKLKMNQCHRTLNRLGKTF
uniref:Error-prone DNA polymerase n=1 Tax=Zeugodacus cucurbitae TaxID=28588 RepID=A0A0A1X7S4_ZEUCU